MADIHQKFLKQLKGVDSVNSLSQLFLDFYERFLIYRKYASRLPKAQRTLEDICQRKPQIKRCMEKCQKEHGDGKFALSDILRQPVFRITKYHLFLHRLFEETLEVE